MLMPQMRAADWIWGNEARMSGTSAWLKIHCHPQRRSAITIPATRVGGHARFSLALRPDPSSSGSIGAWMRAIARGIRIAPATV
jgi:hypothetical protein